MDLFEWSKQYIKFKDCMKKNIQNMTFTQHDIVVEEKERTITYHIYEELDKGIKTITNIQEVIITHNTTHNFDVLIEKWNELIKHKKLTIIFAHPKNNEKWLIHPATHHNISEEKKLKEGLRTLFENITRV